MSITVSIPRVVDSREYLSGTGSVETAAFARMMTAGAGKLIHIYPAASGEYLLDAALTVSTARTQIQHMPGTIIRQTTKYLPIYDVSADDVAIEGLYGKYTGSTTYVGGGPTRGDAPYLFGSMIWSNASRGVFYSNRAEGFTCGINLSSWNGSALTDRTKLDNEIDGLIVSGVWCGVLFGGQVRPKVHNVRGSYATPSGGPDPSHLIYANPSGDATTWTKLNQDVDIAHCLAYDGPGGHAYSLKAILGGKAVDLSSRNCQGWANVFSCTGLRVQGEAADDLGAAEDGSLYTIDVNTGNAYDLLYRAKDATTGALVARIDGKDCSAVIKGRIRQPTNNPGVISVSMLGTRNDVDVDLINVDDDGSDLTTGRLGVAIAASAVDVRVKLRRMRNAYYPAQVFAGASNTTIDLDPTQVVRATSLASAQAIVVGDPSTHVHQPIRAKTETVSSAGQTLIVDPSLYSALHVTVTSADNFTINTFFPGGSSIGMRMLVLIYNNSGGAMGVITWGPTLKGAWTNPANGVRTMIEFTYDGTTWREVV